MAGSDSLSRVSAGALQDFVRFEKEHPEVLSNRGLSRDACVAKMRLMSLAALGAESQTGSVSYAQVQEALQVGPEEVESWVVQAIGANLVEAKMDQLRQTVVITRSLHRVFSRQQWTELATKLGAWRDALASVSAAA